MRSPGIHDPWDELPDDEIITALLLLELADRPRATGSARGASDKLNRDDVVNLVRRTHPRLTRSMVLKASSDVVSWCAVDTRGWRITNIGLRALRDLRETADILVTKPSIRPDDERHVEEILSQGGLLLSGGVALTTGHPSDS